MGRSKIVGGEEMKGEREGGKDTKDEGKSAEKQWKRIQGKTKVQTGTGGEGGRVMAGDGRFGIGRREKYGEKKPERCLAVK